MPTNRRPQGGPRAPRKYFEKKLILPPHAQDPNLTFGPYDGSQSPKPSSPPFWRNISFVGLREDIAAEATIRAYVAQLLTPKLGQAISEGIANLLTPAVIGKIRKRLGAKKPKRRK